MNYQVVDADSLEDAFKFVLKPRRVKHVKLRSIRLIERKWTGYKFVVSMNDEFRGTDWEIPVHVKALSCPREIIKDRFDKAGYEETQPDYYQPKKQGVRMLIIGDIDIITIN